MKKGIRKAICEVLVEDGTHCSGECLCLHIGYCWRTFVQSGPHHNDGLKLRRDSTNGLLMRSEECIEAERKAKR